MYSTIVVGTNGSATADKALAHAAEIAHTNNATLHIVSSVPLLTMSAGTMAGPILVDVGDQAENVLAEASRAVHRDGLTIETHAMQLDPAIAIVEIAKKVEADLVVVGSKGMKGAKRFVLGSVPNSVAHNAPCAVLVVKTC